MQIFLQLHVPIATIITLLTIYDIRAATTIIIIINIPYCVLYCWIIAILIL